MSPVPPDLRNATRSLLLEAELTRIAHSLDAAGTEFAVLKGTPLARRIWGRADGRWIGDNDLLVRAAHARAARDALAPLGYVEDPVRTLEVQMQVDFRLLMRYERDGVRLPAEIHWRAFPPALYPVPDALVWSRLESQEVAGHRLLVPDRSLAIVHLASHFAQHRFSEPRILRDLAGAWERWREEIDVADLLALARATNLHHALDYALGSARSLGYLTVPTPVIRSRRARALRRILPASRLTSVRPEPDYARLALPLVLAGPARAPAWIRTEVLPPKPVVRALRRKQPGASVRGEYLGRTIRAVGRIVTRSRSPRPPPGS